MTKCKLSPIAQDFVNDFHATVSHIDNVMTADRLYNDVYEELDALLDSGKITKKEYLFIDNVISNS